MITYLCSETVEWVELFENNVDFAQERSAASCVFLSSDVTMMSYNTVKVSVLVRYPTFFSEHIQPKGNHGNSQ